MRQQRSQHGQSLLAELVSDFTPTRGFKKMTHDHDCLEINTAHLLGLVKVAVLVLGPWAAMVICARPFDQLSSFTG